MLNSFKDFRLSEGEIVWQAEMSNNQVCVDEDNEEYVPQVSNPSVHFPTDNLAVASNGNGKVHILQTNNRIKISSWVVSFIVDISMLDL